MCACVCERENINDFANDFRHVIRSNREGEVALLRIHCSEIAAHPAIALALGSALQRMEVALRKVVLRPTGCKPIMRKHISKRLTFKICYHNCASYTNHNAVTHLS